MPYSDPSEISFLMEIQHIIAIKRAEKGFGQEYLAEKVDACDREVRRWEHKTKAIQIKILYLYRLAKIFDCSIHDLLPYDPVYGGNGHKTVSSREKAGSKLDPSDTWSHVD